jgi:hypothetical protein
VVLKCMLAVAASFGAAQLATELSDLGIGSHDDASEKARTTMRYTALRQPPDHFPVAFTRIVAHFAGSGAFGGHLNHRIVIAALIPLALTGCEAVKKISDSISGLLNPLVAQGMVLTVQAPDNSVLDLSKTPYEAGTTFTLFLGDAKEADDIDNAPVSGAVVQLDNGGTITVPEVEGGLYALTPGDGNGDLVFQEGASWTTTISRTAVDDDGAEQIEISTGTVELADSAPVTVETTHTHGQDLVVPFPTGFHASIIAVMDVTTGTVTFSNEPEDIKELYEFSTGDDEISEVVIPASAFPDDNTAYAVGVAPVVHTTDDDVDNMNTALSKFMSGTMTFHAVVVGVPLP